MIGEAKSRGRMVIDRKRDTRPAWLRQFLRDDNAATGVEFAMLAIPLIAVLLAALQTSIIFFYNQSLQTATAQAARQIMVGSVQDQAMTKTQFQALVASYAPSAFTGAAIMVDVQSATSFSALNTTPITITYNSDGSVSNNFAFAPGTQNSAVILRVMYNWPVFGGPLGIGLSNQSNGSHLMVATSVFKSEPYQ